MLHMNENTPRRRIFLRQWRKHRQLTQEQLAEALGVDRTVISKIETGKLDYHQTFLENAARALRCEPADLLVRDPTADDPIWSVWDGVAESERPRILAVIRALKSTMETPPKK